MSLSVLNVGGNPQVPGIAAEAFIPDQLIAGQKQIVTDSVTITGAAALKRGSVLGRILSGSTAAAVAGANTGNGVMGAVTAGADALPGVYTLKVTQAATNAGAFEVFDPRGELCGVGNVATAFAGGGLSFTLADGATDFVFGDSFTITVTPGTEKYKLSALAAVDGSQRPVAILADDVDATGGDVIGGIYLEGEFNQNALTFGVGMTAAIAKAQLGAVGIRLKASLSAADPS